MATGFAAADVMVNAALVGKKIVINGETRHERPMPGDPGFHIGVRGNFMPPRNSRDPLLPIAARAAGLIVICVRIAGFIYNTGLLKGG